MIVKLHRDFRVVEMALAGHHHVCFLLSPLFEHLRELGELGVQLLLKLGRQLSVHSGIRDFHGVGTSESTCEPVSDAWTESAYPRGTWRPYGGSPGCLRLASAL